MADESAKKPLLIANCAKAKFEPKNVIITCGEASFGTRGMTWSSPVTGSAQPGCKLAAI